MGNIPDSLHNFIMENFLFGDSTKMIGPAESFLEKGIVDSTGVLELVAFVEDQFGIRVEDDELLPENFDSIVNLSNYVQSKLAGLKNAAS